MFAWIARRREIARQTEADATALIAEHGARAYAEARRRQQDAIDAEDAARWRRAAVAIAKRTGKRIGLDTATRMAEDADMTATTDVARTPRHVPPLARSTPWTNCRRRSRAASAGIAETSSSRGYPQAAPCCGDSPAKRLATSS